MSLTHKHYLSFGEFRLNLEEGVLLRRGQLVRIPPKTLETLTALVRHRGEVVGKDELLAEIWPGTFVEEANLAQHISLLRKALGEDGDTTYIETIPRKGYRFLAPVEEAESNGWAGETGAQPPASFPETGAVRPWLRYIFAVTLAVLLGAGIYALVRWQRSRSQIVGIHSLAVLPLDNYSGDPSEEYFADGMTEAIITELARVNSVRVISRTSVMAYRSQHKPVPVIAKELHVDAVVEGAVLRSGDHIRITAQLINARTDQHLWADIYEGTGQDMERLPRRIARDILAHIRAPLTPQQRSLLARDTSASPQVTEAYLKGLFFWNKRTIPDFVESIDYFHQAVTAGPNYAPAYAGLADAYALLGSAAGSPMPRGEAMAKARAAAKHAIELDPDLAAAHAALAFIEMHYDWDWQAADAEYQKAIDLNPSYATAYQWRAYNYVALGHLDQALAENAKAQRLDPLSAIIATDQGELLFYARRYDEAVAVLHSVLELHPDFPIAHLFLSLAYRLQGRPAEALEEAKKFKALEPGGADADSSLASAYAAAGQKAKAERILATSAALQRSGTAFSLASALVALGQNQEALASLRRSYDERLGPLIMIQVDPEFDPLRSNPRFQQLVHMVGAHPPVR